MKSNTVIDRGWEIVKILWPEVELEPPGSFWDKYGIDGQLNGKSTQIKNDRRIYSSGNLYHEIYEKSSQREDQPWRKAGGKVDQYIFTTESGHEVIGYLINVDILAELEINKALRVIQPNNGGRTSIGFLIAIKDIPINKIEYRHLLKEFIF